jgi:hypothetical protein
VKSIDDWRNRKEKIMNEKYIGKIELGNKVDITDPCYSKNVWCRMTTDCTPGTYYGYAEKKKGKWGDRISRLCIRKDDEKGDPGVLSKIGNIGVDSGMAGFFNNKPDFTDEQWDEFCKQVYRGDSWVVFNGICSHSGVGDGSYDVYANKERTVFVLIFD